MSDSAENWKLRVAAYCGDHKAAEKAGLVGTLTIPADLEGWVENLADNAPSPSLLGTKINVVAALLLYQRSVGLWERSDTLWLLDTLAAAARAWLDDSSDQNFTRASKLASGLGDLPFIPALGADSEPTRVAALAATATVQEVREAQDRGAYSIYAAIVAGHMAGMVGEEETRRLLQTGIMKWVESYQS